MRLDTTIAKIVSCEDNSMCSIVRTRGVLRFHGKNRNAEKQSTFAALHPDRGCPGIFFRLNLTEKFEGN